jgi:hypothetical protein
MATLPYGLKTLMMFAAANSVLIDDHLGNKFSRKKIKFFSKKSIRIWHVITFF